MQIKIWWPILFVVTIITASILIFPSDLRLADLRRQTDTLDGFESIYYNIVYGRPDIVRALIGRGAELDGMGDLAARGAAGEFEEFPDVARPAQFAEIVTILRDEFSAGG